MEVLLFSYCNVMKDDCYTSQTVSPGVRPGNRSGSDPETQTGPHRPRIRYRVHRPHVSGGVEQPGRMAEAPDPALRKPVHPPGLLRPALRSTGEAQLT